MVFYTFFKTYISQVSLEIIAKTRINKGVLEPFSSQGNKDLFLRAGFKDMKTLFKYINFEGFLWIK